MNPLIKHVPESSNRNATPLEPTRAVCVLLILFAAPSWAQAQTSCPASGWQDNFSGSQLDPTRWVIANGQAPGYIPGYHIGYYQPDRVIIGGGYLGMLLTQEIGKVDTNPAGVISMGALIYTKFQCGYGTYEWTMRMSSTATCPTCSGSPVSGSVSAGFNYVNNSQTEIDFEFSALNPTSLYLVNWLNPNPALDPSATNETYTAVSPFDSTSSFHTYRFVWEANKITYYIDPSPTNPTPTAVHTTNVPSAPANFMINHWGTDSGNWGGTATIGTPRYFYVYSVSYNPTPPPAPTNLRATAGNAQVSLSWTGSSGATSYNVKRSTVSGGPYKTITPPGSVTATSYTDTGLTNGTRYYYVVTAVNPAGESLHSNQASAIPSAPSPNFSISASPPSQAVSHGSSTSYTVSVTGLDGFSGVVSFNVSGLPSRSSAGFSPSSVTGSGGSTLTVSTSTGTPTGNYTLTIRGTSGTLSHSAKVGLTVN